jgi:hypothetical protein
MGGKISWVSFRRGGYPRFWSSSGGPYLL